MYGWRSSCVARYNIYLYSIFSTFYHTDENDSAFYTPFVIAQSLQVRKKLFLETSIILHIDSMLNFHKQIRIMIHIQRRLREAIVSRIIENRIKVWRILLDKRDPCENSAIRRRCRFDSQCIHFITLLMEENQRLLVVRGLHSAQRMYSYTYHNWESLYYCYLGLENRLLILVLRNRKQDSVT